MTHNVIVSLFVGCLCTLAASQVAWTPIYLDGQSQVDLWTQEANGCRCSFDSSRNDCACCVPNGGCHCGKASPNRCQQCGLEQHCANMCNVTIDARILQARSGKTFGQIKSPQLEGPSFCWYLLQPGRNQRVEVQVYRLLSVGRFNGTSCTGGFVQLVDGAEPNPKPEDTQLCGQNERFTPPAVMFADRGAATLLFRVMDSTIRSQFLAYFSFTPIEQPVVGFQARGGQRKEHTECDWLYQDYACREPRSCMLASPGFPGVYPPNRQCKYLVTTSSIHTRVRIGFLSLLLPHNHCGTDYIAIYQGSSSSGPLLNTICGNRKVELNYTGPNLLIEFSSGPPIPPYDYNGFVAYLEFSDLPGDMPHTETSVGMSRTTEPGIILNSKSAAAYTEDQSSTTPGVPRKLPNSVCDFVFYGNTTRSGHFDTRTTGGWPQDRGPAVCRLNFIGKRNDVVHVSFFNYELRRSSCESAIEIYDGTSKKGAKPVQKICSPATRHARDPGGRFLEQQNFLSTGSMLTILFRIGRHSQQEVLDGAYLFHDERAEGTVRPEAMCAVEYQGTRSPASGEVYNPGTQQTYWNVESPLNCTQRFTPTNNQSITIAVTDVGHSKETHCSTSCDTERGCTCVPHNNDMFPLEQMDHLAIVTDSGLQLACICGEIKSTMLPIAVRSGESLSLLYHVSHYSWNMQGFSYRASYNFAPDRGCGAAVFSDISGAIDFKAPTGGVVGSPNKNRFHHHKCLWLLYSNVERQLTIEISTIHSPATCSSWNITILRPSKNGQMSPTPTPLHTFCPSERRRSYTLPWKIQSAYIRLQALSRMQPVFNVRWNSLIVKANNRVSGPNDAAVHSSSYIISPLWYFTLAMQVLCVIVYTH